MVGPRVGFWFTLCSEDSTEENNLPENSAGTKEPDVEPATHRERDTQVSEPELI